MMRMPSRIGISLQNGKVLSVLSCSDARPVYTGAILLLYYNSEEKVKKLLNYGDIVRLGADTGDDNVQSPKLIEYNKLWFPTVCRFYKRDEKDPLPCRGWEDTENIMVQREEYCYLWKDGRWWYGCHRVRRFYPLGDKKCNITKEMRKAVKEDLGE